MKVKKLRNTDSVFTMKTKLMFYTIFPVLLVGIEFCLASFIILGKDAMEIVKPLAVITVITVAIVAIVMRLFIWCLVNSINRIIASLDRKSVV